MLAYEMIPSYEYVIGSTLFVILTIFMFSLATILATLSVIEHCGEDTGVFVFVVSTIGSALAILFMTLHTIRDFSELNKRIQNYETNCPQQTAELEPDTVD